jgi:excisionase family DNA binding protein
VFLSLCAIMPELPSELLIAAEVTGWLRITRSTAYAWAATGKIPSVKLNGAIRFVRADLERWIQERSRMVPEPPTSESRSILPPPMPDVSRVTIQRAGARAIRQVRKRHASPPNSPRERRVPTADPGERKERR